MVTSLVDSWVLTMRFNDNSTCLLTLWIVSLRKEVCSASGPVAALDGSVKYVKVRFL